MKCIHYIVYHEFLNDIEVGDFHCSSPVWHYGEPCKTTEVVNSDFDEIINDVNNEVLSFSYIYVSNKLFTKEPCLCGIDMYSDFGKTLRITKSKFKNIKRIVEVVKVPTCVTFTRIMEKLPSNEFIEYCNDNGLSVCPMQK